jgi:Bacterial dnaA protein helix-turn-helix
MQMYRVTARSKRRTTGSEYLDELIVRRGQIRDRIWKRQNAPRLERDPDPEPQPQPEPTIFSPLPQQNIKSVEERIAEARRLDLPAVLMKSIIENIRESATWFGEQLPAPTFDLLPEVKFPGKPTIARIQSVTARHFNLHLNDIVCERHYSRMALPRHIAMYLSKELTSNTSAEIGRRFGRNPSTILRAMRRLTKLIETDKALAEEIATLRGMLES